MLQTRLRTTRGLRVSSSSRRNRRRLGCRLVSLYILRAPVDPEGAFCTAPHRIEATKTRRELTRLFDVRSQVKPLKHWVIWNALWLPTSLHYGTTPTPSSRCHKLLPSAEARRSSRRLPSTLGGSSGLHRRVEMSGERSVSVQSTSRARCTTGRGAGAGRASATRAELTSLVACRSLLLDG